MTIPEYVQCQVCKKYKLEGECVYVRTPAGGFSQVASMMGAGDQPDSRKLVCKSCFQEFNAKQDAKKR